MNEERIKLSDRLVRPRNEALTADTDFRAVLLEDRTLFNVEALGREYKLAQAYASVRNLEFRAEKTVELQTFRNYIEFRKDLLKLRFSVDVKPRPQFPPDESYRNTQKPLHYPLGEMLILVDDAVYDAISASINQYVLDVGRDGYWATVHVVNGGTSADVRGYINEFNPVGVLLVGAIPAPWFEMDDDFHNVHSEFPCDLYYMDTNGVWSDPDNDGKFSGLTGNVNPEIWVGRIWTPTQNGNNVALINDYFTRNHKFRLGALGHARSAMAFVDDDWQSFDDCEFDELFPTSLITKYTNPNITDSDLYKAEVNSLRSWVQLCAHSSPHSHALWVPSANQNEYIASQYFRDTNPPNGHFYNLFCCGPGRYTTGDYLAGWYVFDKSGGGTTHGLAAIASAKSGSMLMFADFYRPQGQGRVIGDAFVDWWLARGPTHSLADRRWFYGLVLLGDPTLAWWKGAVPHLEQPEKEDLFDHWPRKMQLRWDPVNLPGVKYQVEIDAYGAVNAGKWAEETNQVFLLYHNVTGNTLDHNFVGAQRGRWRVRAKIDAQVCAWSPWSYFRFTV